MSLDTALDSVLKKCAFKKKTIQFNLIRKRLLLPFLSFIFDMIFAKGDKCVDVLIHGGWSSYIALIMNTWE